MELDQIPVDPFGLQEVEPSASASIPTEDADDRSYSAKMLQSMAEMQKKGHFCDVTLRAKVSQEDFKVHSVVMAAASPHLYGQLMKMETCEEGQKLCILPVTSACLQSLLSYLYTGEFHDEIDLGDRFDLFELADEWQMEELMSLCHVPLNILSDNENSIEPDCNGMPTNNSDDENVKLCPSPVQTNPPTSCLIQKEVPEKRPKRRKREDSSIPKKFVGRGVKIPEGVLEERIERPFMCKMCKADFADKSNCIEHLLLIHNVSVEHVENFLWFPSRLPKSFPAVLPKRYRCALEGCLFVSLKVLPVLVHRFTEHNIPMPEDRPHQVEKCDVCGKICGTKSEMKIHRLIHDGERPYLCDSCPMSFSRKASLKKHVHALHSEEGKKFPCPSCHYVAKSMKYLKTHMLRHGGHKLYLCHHCAYSSINLTTLKAHIKSYHSSESDTDNVGIKSNWVFEVNDVIDNIENKVLMGE